MTTPASEIAAPAFQVLKRAQIVRSRTNPRTHFDAAYITEMGKSLKAHGFLQPMKDCPAEHVAPILLLALVYDELEADWRHNGKSFPAAELVATAAGVDIAAVQAEVQADMKAEAEQRAAAPAPGAPAALQAAAKTPGKAKAAPKKKTTAKEAAAGISQALQAADDKDSGHADTDTETVSTAAWPFPLTA